MRIIAGEYRGRILKSPADNRTRPTSDRLRETLFNIITPKIGSDTRFLDLCAGTGAIGIEALSRGAYFVTFVDKSRRSCGLIEQNLDLLGVPEEETEVVCASAETFTNRKYAFGWDIVFFDPPYQIDYSFVLRDFGDTESTLLNDGGILIVEHHSKNALNETYNRLRRFRLVKQGESCLSFYERH